MKFKRKIKVGDTVKVIAGSFKNTISTVIKFDGKRVFVADVNVKIVFVNRKQIDEKTQKPFMKKVMMRRESPMDISNVCLFNTRTKEKAKIGYSEKDNLKIRIDKKTNKVI